MTLPGKQEIILSKTVEEIEQKNRVADILRILRSASISLGANRISYHLTPKLHSQTDESVHLIAEGFPKKWIELYEHEHLREHDPIPDIVMQHGEPMLWQDAIKARKLNPQERNFVAQLEAFGLHEGIGIPLFGQKVRSAYSSFSFRQSELLFDKKLILKISTLALSAHVRICRVLERDEDINVHLSERESQVMRLIGNGRSSKVIAADLGISQTTAETYVRRIFTKLEVNDRVGATIRALELGILNL